MNYSRSFKLLHHSQYLKQAFMLIPYVVEFSVDGVQTFTWNDEPFTNLVLPRDQKSLILSLVEAHTQGISQGFDDFVRGKGQGLVVNLFGNPGVGKSLTAEATSEREFSMTCIPFPCLKVGLRRCEETIVCRRGG